MPRSESFVVVFDLLCWHIFFMFWVFLLVGPVQKSTLQQLIDAINQLAPEESACAVERSYGVAGVIQLLAKLWSVIFADVCVLQVQLMLCARLAITVKTRSGEEEDKTFDRQVRN